MPKDAPRFPAAERPVRSPGIRPAPVDSERVDASMAGRASEQESSSISLRTGRTSVSTDLGFEPGLAAHQRPATETRPLTKLPGRQDHLQLPQREASSPFLAIVSFIICVVLPVVASAAYFLFFAANQYVSEFRFAVTDTSSISSSSSGGGGVGASPILAMIGAGSTSSASSNFIVTQYLSSEQVITDLQKKFDLISLFGKPASDWWYRFDTSKPIEYFVRYWPSMVSAQYDVITGTATVSVRAFSPEDAHLIATSMVKLAEELVNRLQQRMLSDGLKTAEAEVAKAENRVRATRAKIAEFRATYGVIDPNSSIVASNAALAQSLRATVAQLQTNVDTLLAQNMNANSQVVRSLQSQIKAVREQIAAIETDVSKGSAASGGKSLSELASQYEQLDLERQFAVTSLAGTQQALDMARASAAIQHLYLTPFVEPNMPRSSLYPKRLLSIALIGFIALMLWVLLFLVARSIREHYR
jgi:capsular polysaccharide transport system permease protein